MKIDTDFKSKWFDGILSMVLLFLSMMGLIFLIRPFEAQGDLGYLIYGILMLGLAAYCLFRAINEKLSTIGRAWYGVFSGLFFWTVTEMGQKLGWTSIEGWEGSYLVVMALMILYLIWKFFPIGVKTAAALFMFNWGGHVLIHLMEHIFAGNVLTSIFNVSAIIYSLLSLGTVYIIFFRAQNRINRFWGAIWLWHFISMTVFIFRQ